MHRLPIGKIPMAIAIPIGSMYGIFTYVWLIFMVNVGIYIYHTWILWDMNNVTLGWSIRRCLDGPKNLWTLVEYHLVRKRRQFHLKTLDVFWCFFCQKANQSLLMLVIWKWVGWSETKCTYIIILHIIYAHKIKHLVGSFVYSKKMNWEYKTWLSNGTEKTGWNLRLASGTQCNIHLNSFDLFGTHWMRKLQVSVSSHRMPAQFSTFRGVFPNVTWPFCSDVFRIYYWNMKVGCQHAIAKAPEFK